MTNMGISEPQKLAEYDVFLSFRGSDTRKTFTDCLHHDLIGAGIRVFRDDEELYKGREIATELPRAIDNCKICIPIFSKNYATSAWCLREVAHMVECRQRGALEIMPVFYDVDVSNVKLRTGSTYEVHIEEHVARFEEEVILQWKNALKEVAKLKGWDVKSAGGHGELIKSIVGDILVKLNIKYRNLPRGFVEPQDQVDTLMNLIDVDTKGVRFIVIYGMGGIGKTTLANVIFNKLSSHYEGSSFLESVREDAQRHGRTYLQQKLLSNILNHDFTKCFYDINGGINNIRGRLCTKKLIIVIDDVDKDDQLKILAGKSGWFGSGSRIIITTRDLQVLSMQGEVHNYYFHEMKQMKFNDALCLFSQHAFGKNHPPNKYYNVLSKKIVSATGCLPLALEVIGSCLFHLCLNSSESNRIWEETLKELSVPDKEVEHVLMMSINKLNFHQRQIFLDVASVLINEDKTYAIHMWDDCGYSPHRNINTLIQMSLIKITNNNELWMHDILRDLGRQLIRNESRDNPGRCTRVSNEQEAQEFIKKRQDIGSIEVLYLNLDECSLVEDALPELEKLRLLKLQGKFQTHYKYLRFLLKWREQSKGNFKIFLSNLRWLRWQECPSDFQSINFYPRNLVVLERHNSSISENWKGWEQIKMAKKLKVLDLTGCKRLRKTPDLSSFLNLERLILRNCDGLVEVDPSIGKLEKLTYLNMEGCSSLVDLPESIEGLTNLNYLSLRLCEDFMKLPKSIGNIKSLVELDISVTCITELPDSIGNLQSLKVINMSKSRIRRIPATLGLLRSLEALYASECSKLEGEIPREIGGLSSLKILDLGNSPITISPESINNLSNLEWIWLKLPDAYENTDLRWISTFFKLKSFTIESSRVNMVGDELACHTQLENLALFCPNLEGNIKFPSGLRDLLICDVPFRFGSTLTPAVQLDYGLSQAFAISNLGELHMLRQLTLRSRNLCCLDGLHLLRNLRQLIITYYRNRIPDLSSLKNLAHLALMGCDGLVEIQGLGELHLLQDLRLLKCNSLEVVSGMSNLIKLKVLHISACKKLRDVQGLESLTSLLLLVIEHCNLLETLPGKSLLYDQLVGLIIACPMLPIEFEIRNKELFYFLLMDLFLQPLYHTVLE